MTSLSRLASFDGDIPRPNRPVHVGEFRQADKYHSDGLPNHYEHRCPDQLSSIDELANE